MTVKELKEILAGALDSAIVVIEEEEVREKYYYYHADIQTVKSEISDAGTPLIVLEI